MANSKDCTYLKKWNVLLFEEKCLYKQVFYVIHVSSFYLMFSNPAIFTSASPLLHSVIRIPSKMALIYFSRFRQWRLFYVIVHSISYKIYSKFLWNVKIIKSKCLAMQKIISWIGCDSNFSFHDFNNPYVWNNSS